MQFQERLTSMLFEFFSNSPKGASVIKKKPNISPCGTHYLLHYFPIFSPLCIPHEFFCLFQNNIASLLCGFTIIFLLLLFINSHTASFSSARSYIIQYYYISFLVNKLLKMSLGLRKNKE